MSKESEKRKVREIIKELREDRGYTFRQISEALKSEYNIQCTRQNVHQIYTRMLHTEKKRKIATKLELSSDDINTIIVLKSYGIKPSKMMQILPMLGCNADRSVVKQIVSAQRETITKSRAHKIQIISDAVKAGESVPDILEKITYKGYIPSIDELKGLMAESTLQHVVVLRILKEYRKNHLGE